MRERSKSYKLPIKRDVLLRILFCCLFAVFSLCLSPLGVHTGHAVTLSWNASTGDVAGYKVYSGTSSGSYNGTTYDAGKFTTMAITGLTAGTTYYFAAKAYSTSGLESSFSNQVTYTEPASSSSGTSTGTSTSPSNTVTYALKPYVCGNLSCSVGGSSYGSISPSTTVNVASGSSYTFKITPFTGHKIIRVWVDGSYVGTPTSYTFTNVTKAHNIVVVFQ